MHEIIEVRHCRECGNKIAGRSDKKFCSAQCRVSYNNRLISEHAAIVRSTNIILRRNWRILHALNPTGKTRISRDNLLQSGFNLEFFTGMYKNKDGAVYKYCYDQGYLAVDNEHFLLVVKKV